MIKFAIISFPGTNCENENVRAFKRNGMDAETVLWNDPSMLDGSRAEEFDGYCIAGGFSYEDRSRSGIIAAQNPIMEVIKKEAAKGKVVLGICNGAQVLVERGLIPGFENYDLAAGLAWNEMTQGGEVVDTGFYNNWSYLKNVAPQNRSAFNGFEELLHVPFAHGEGRFVFKDPAVLEKLKENQQVIFQYCSENGEVSTEYPITPNGATEAIAGLCNPAGNVMSIMPHPERDPKGNGDLIFESIRKWIEEKKSSEARGLGSHETPEDIRAFDSFDLEFLVRLIIVDNAERTVEMTLKRAGFNVEMSRYQYWGVNLASGVDKKEAALKIIESGELANLNKEQIYVRLDQPYEYKPGKDLVPVEMKADSYFVTCDQKDFLGESKKASINLHSGQLIDRMQSGVFWKVEGVDKERVQDIIGSKVLYNPNAMYVMKS